MDTTTGFTVEKASGNITVTCKGCGEVKTGLDKGLVRASIATWRTRHQHLDK